MNVVIIDTFSEKVITRTGSGHVPRIGECVDFGYAPLPKVTSVINYPNKDTLKNLGFKDPDEAVDVIVLMGN